MGYSVQTEWPHILPPLQDPHVLTIAAQVGRTASQVLHRWALQRGVGVIPKATSVEHIVENARLLDFELSEVQMRCLDGLATLSESGVSRTKPAHQEDFYRLGSLAAGGTPTASAIPAASQASQPIAGAGDDAATSRDKGFAFGEIRDHLLGQAQPLGPHECELRCAATPECAAWEVCAPLDPQAGCDGCYLIGQAPANMLRIEGWHAGILRGR